MPWAMRQPGSPNGTPMTGAYSMHWGWRRTKRSAALSISAGRPSRPKTGRARRCRRSSRAFPASTMFYDTRDNSRTLPHDPFKAIVAPRPIGWITSISARGDINLAPYSYFNGVLSRPNLVMFSSEGFKDSVRNIRETEEFVCNLATWDLREAMNATSAPFPYGVNEMVRAGLE